MSFQFGSQTAVEARVSELEVRLDSAAGGYLLVVSGSLSHIAREGAERPIGLPVLMTGEVHADALSGSNQGRLNLGPLLPGHREPLPILWKGPAPLVWVVELSYEAFDALEQHRHGQDLTLTLRVNATLLGSAVQETDGELAWPAVTRQTSIHIHRTEWVRHLDNIDAAAGVLVAVHPRPYAAGTRYADALGYLRAARRLLDGGQYPQAVAEARKVLDVLNEIDRPPVNDPQDVAPKQRTKAQRWSRLRTAVTELANAAPHGDATAAQVTWDRQDAQAVIATVAALLARHPQAGAAGAA